MPVHEVYHDQRIFGYLLHHGAVQTGNCRVKKMRRLPRGIDKTAHHRIVAGEDHLRQRGVASVADIKSLFAVHAVLNYLLHAVSDRIGAELPDPHDIRTVRTARADCKRKRIVPRGQAYVLHRAALRDHQFSIPEGFEIVPVRGVVPAREDELFLITAVAPHFVSDVSVGIGFLPAFYDKPVPVFAADSEIEITDPCRTEVDEQPVSPAFDRDRRYSFVYNLFCRLRNEGIVGVFPQPCVLPSGIVVIRALKPHRVSRSIVILGELRVVADNPDRNVCTVDGGEKVLSA